MSENLKLGQIINEPQQRDAIHIAVVPVVAAVSMQPGTRCGIDPTGKAAPCITASAYVGVVDPFLREAVPTGAQFWLFLEPGSITSLRHEWTHPAFGAVEAPVSTKEASEKWMRAWAVEHMSEDYYGDWDSKRSPEHAYADAIRAGHEHYVGPYESVNAHINDEWWTHWENITGVKGDREAYFRCAC
jgi:hypothetical protein